MEDERITFDYREVVEMMLRAKGIKEGRWKFAVEFSLGAINIQNPSDEMARPAAIVPLVNVGIIRRDEEEIDNLTVDAATLT